MFPFVPDNCLAPLPLPVSVLLLKVEFTREESFDLIYLQEGLVNLFLGENGRELTMSVRGDATFEFLSTALDFEDAFKETPERRPATECDGRNFT
jgi:hypothetical protein